MSWVALVEDLLIRLAPRVAMGDDKGKRQVTSELIRNPLCPGLRGHKGCRLTRTIAATAYTTLIINREL